MVDAATPLLGMVLRLKDMENQPLPDQLYQQVVTDIRAIEQFLQTKGYEPGAMVRSATCFVPLSMRRR